MSDAEVPHGKAHVESEDRPRQKGGYRLEQIDGELLLYHLNEARVIYFNQAASTVWQLCDGSRSVSEIADLVSDAFPDDSLRVKRDVVDCIGLFLDAGCIELVSTGLA